MWRRFLAVTLAIVLGFGFPSASLAESKEKHPEQWSKDAVIYEVNIRQYTPEGTFKAFEEHLPRLRKLGVDILWVMPIYPISKERRVGTLGSYYSVHDYTAVNPEFGTMEDFKRLVDKAHRMGFKVILDFVPNHTGWDHEWIREHPDWYITDSEGNIVHPPGTNWYDVAQLNYDNAEMRAAMIEEMKFWVKEADIDGYRMDVAGRIPTDFWETARKELDKIKPIYMLAEDDTNLELLKNAFHSNYGWRLHNIMVDIAKGEKNAEAVKSYLTDVQQTYPKGSYPMHFITNHDINSWNGTTSELFGESEKAMAILAFVVPGMPLIYSGQEAGLNKRLKFFEKDEIPWDDLSMQDFYEKLVQLKKENPALWNGIYGGKVNFLETSDERVLAFAREKKGNKVVVIMNLSADDVSSMVDVGPFAGSYNEYFSNVPFELSKEQTFDLEPWGYQVLVQGSR